MITVMANKTLQCYCYITGTCIPVFFYLCYNFIRPWLKIITNVLTMFSNKYTKWNTLYITFAQEHKSIEVHVPTRTCKSLEQRMRVDYHTMPLVDFLTFPSVFTSYANCLWLTSKHSQRYLLTHVNTKVLTKMLHITVSVSCTYMQQRQKVIKHFATIFKASPTTNI